MSILQGAGKDAALELQRTVDDIQASLDKRWAALVALLQGKRIKVNITIEMEDKEKA